jgi:hypothetical protein
MLSVTAEQDLLFIQPVKWIYLQEFVILFTSLQAGASQVIFPVKAVTHYAHGLGLSV